MVFMEVWFLSQLNKMKKNVFLISILLASCSNDNIQYLEPEMLPDAQINKPYYHVISIPQKKVIEKGFIGTGYPYYSGLTWKPSYSPNTYPEIKRHNYDYIIIEGTPKKVDGVSNEIVFSFLWDVYGNGNTTFYKAYHIEVKE